MTCTAHTHSRTCTRRRTGLNAELWLTKRAHLMNIHQAGGGKANQPFGGSIFPGSTLLLIAGRLGQASRLSTQSGGGVHRVRPLCFCYRSSPGRGHPRSLSVVIWSPQDSSSHPGPKHSEVDFFLKEACTCPLSLYSTVPDWGRDTAVTQPWPASSVTPAAFPSPSFCLSQGPCKAEPEARVIYPKGKDHNRYKGALWDGA